MALRDNPRGIAETNNELIESCHDKAEGDAYFWSLCVPKQKVKMRNCMRCKKSFRSVGKGHRHCASCARVIRKYLS